MLDTLQVVLGTMYLNFYLTISNSLIMQLVIEIH